MAIQRRMGIWTKRCTWFDSDYHLDFGFIGPHLNAFEASLTQ